MALPGSNMEQLNFGERDLSNAAKEIRRPTPPRLPERPCSPLLSQTDPLRPFEVQVPDMIRQLLGAVNQLVSFATTMADVKFKGDEVAVAASNSCGPSCISLVGVAMCKRMTCTIPR
jgi:hypothetical protein